MSSIIEQYNSIYKNIKSISDQIKERNERIAEIRSGGEGDIAERIENLEQLIEKIDDYVLKIRAFQEIAKKNLDSQNVLTIEAPPNYRVNINRLKDWAMMIDPMSSNDPYAQRVLAVAKCDEHFLQQKKNEFQMRINELKEDRTTGLTHEMSRLEDEVKGLQEQFLSILDSDEFNNFASSVVNANQSFWFESVPKTHGLNEHNDSYSVGSHSVSLPFGTEQTERLGKLLGKFYDGTRGNVLIPLQIQKDAEFVVSVVCAPSKTKQVDKGIQNFLLQQIEYEPVGERKIYVLDAIRYNSNSLGELKLLENTFVINQIPRNPEQLTSTLEQLVSSFIEIDELIDINDSVREYNKLENIKKKIEYSTLVLFGWPNSFSSRDRELINRILANYERYGVSVIVVNYQTMGQNVDEKKILPEYALYNSVRIKAGAKTTTVMLPDSDVETFFAWYPFLGSVRDEYVESIKDKSPLNDLMGNDYTERYDLTVLPSYTREKKPIVLPFGVDGKDNEQSISFDKNNFAAYLIGDSGSGKSTLIHTIIAGILREHHPDNVELWLADFKQVEFKQYIDHRPPHVKYILLDEAHEMVYDLIDKLNDEMLARQQLLARLGKEKVDEIDVRAYGKAVPLIFVILDEFSIMSQAIEEDQSYRLKLQNLLAKGRALGFKFLFASQKFTSGVAGLTPTAKDQIQQRISMKAPKDEITEVLALSPALKTEKVQNWVDTLPPYYALVKRRIDDDNLEVARMKVMYFSDNYESRDLFIDSINNKMVQKDGLNYDDIWSYVDKSPVIVDGNSYEAFNIDYLKSKHKQQMGADNNDYENELYLALGTPRLMSEVKFLTLSPESRENILLIGKTSEQACVASLLLTTIMMAKDQGKRVTIWAYGRNPVLRTYRNSFEESQCKVLSDMEGICKDIKRIKDSIRQGVLGNEVVILLGMDRVYGDFEYNAQPEASAKSAKSVDVLFKQPVAEDEEEIFEHNLKMMLMEKRSALIKSLKEEGKDDDTIKTEIQKMVEEERKRAYEARERKGISSQIVESNEESVKENINSTVIENNDIYNASDDFTEVVKMGSRLGYHFVLCLNSASDIKNMGLKVDFFRHRVAFQLSEDDSYTLYGRKIATGLPEHTCLYDDSFTRYSMKPYLHKAANWDGWTVDDENNAKSPLE